MPATTAKATTAKASKPKGVARKPRAKSTVPRHPTYVTMCTKAIASDKSRKGTSRAAIKNYLGANFAFEPKNYAIANALTKGCTEGAYVQDGARFRLTPAGKKTVK